jgi:hypothetical protein
MIETLGFDIYFHGDPSVGIFPNYWQMSGHFIFDHEIEEDMFIQGLLVAFEYCSDTPIVITARSRRANGEFIDRQY